MELTHNDGSSWTYVPRLLPALIDWEPYENPDDPQDPCWGPISMVGTCPTHGFQRVTQERTIGRADPTRTFFFACGCVDGDATFGP